MCVSRYFAVLPTVQLWSGQPLPAGTFLHPLGHFLLCNEKSFEIKCLTALVIVGVSVCVFQRLSGSHKSLVEMQDDVSELLRSATREYPSTKVCENTYTVYPLGVNLN